VRIVVVEFTATGGMIHYAYQLCAALAEHASVTLVTGRDYELRDLVPAFRVEPMLPLWNPKPATDTPATGLRQAIRLLRRTSRAVRYYRAWWHLTYLLLRERPDVVQFGDIRFVSDLVCFALLKRAGLRLVDICHNVRPVNASRRSRGGICLDRLTRWIFRAIYHQFDLVLVHYEVNRREFLARFELPAERVAVIPHGNEELFRVLAARRRPPPDGALREELHLAPGDPVILLIGSLSHYKGIDRLLHAFATVRRHAPQATLVIAGYALPEFDLPAHQRLAEALGVADAVRFVPRYLPAETVARWMDEAAVAVFPYREVSQSGALHLAQTFGVPIVASAVGATPEVIVDGESGLLVPPEDAEALATAILAILRQPELGRRLGARARQDAMTRFTWPEVAAVCMERYRTLLDGTSGGAGPAEARRLA